MTTLRRSFLLTSLLLLPSLPVLSAQERTIRGVIVQLSQSQLTVESGGTHVALSVIRTTTGDVARLAVGQSVRVVYMEADVLVARDVRIVPRP